MCEYYFDEDHGVAYKIDPVNASLVNGGNGNPTEILVHTDVKVTNIKKEKVRRTLAEAYPTNQYDLDSAKKIFVQRLVSKLINGARQISEDQYQEIKQKFEA